MCARCASVGCQEAFKAIEHSRKALEALEGAVVPHSKPRKHMQESSAKRNYTENNPSSFHILFFNISTFSRFFHLLAPGNILYVIHVILALLELAWNLMPFARICPFAVCAIFNHCDGLCREFEIFETVGAFFRWKMRGFWESKRIWELNYWNYCRIIGVLKFPANGKSVENALNPQFNWIFRNLPDLGEIPNGIPAAQKHSRIRHANFIQCIIWIVLNYPRF